MSVEVKMPALGESVTEGTVSAWLKNVGDRVEADEPILEVSTDKVDTEVPSPASGVLLEIRVQEDDTVEVGTVLAIIGEPTETPNTMPTPAVTTTTDTPSEVTTSASVVSANITSAPAAMPNSSTASGIEVKMPALGESVTEGTVSAWLKNVGDQVETDEPLLEVSTDKVDTEVPSPASGVLLEIRVQEDDTVEVGTVLAIIGEPGQAPISAPTPVVETVQPMQTTPANTEPEPPTVSHEQVLTEHSVTSHEEAECAPFATNVKPKERSGEAGYVTPIVRKLAKELGVSLANVTGTGVGGRIRKQDVEAIAPQSSTNLAQTELSASLPSTPAAPSVPSAPAVPSVPAAPSTPAASSNINTSSDLRGQRKKMSGLRKTIAKRMVESIQVSAQLTTVVEVDVTKIVSLRARAKDSFQSREGTKLTFLPFFVKAATEAIKVHPIINASVQDNEIVYHDVEHIGIAVDTPKGLFVPVIRDCGNKSVAGIAHSINDLAARTRDGQITPDELTGSTFTITNTGSGGALFDTPIINQPEVAILGVGSIVKRPVVVKDAVGNDSIAIRSMIYLAISYDHRIVDGADAARYLMTVKKRLEEGDFEAEVGL